MASIALELRGQCFSCGSSLPLNALVPQIACGKCQQATSFGPATWSSLLEDVIREGRNMQPGESRSSSMMTGDGTYQIRYARMKPSCAACKAEIPVEYAISQMQRGWLQCRCGQWNSTRALPYGLDPKVFNRVTCIIGEDSSQFSGSQTGAALQVGGASQAVMLNCPSCGGQLRIDGTSRQVQCQFCRGSVYLPDDLWHRLHPVQVVRRWYLFYDDRPRPGCQLVDIRAAFPQSDNGTAEIQSWHVTEGQTVQQGQPLVTVEYCRNDDDNTAKIISPVYGAVTELFKDEMDDVNQGEVLCRIETMAR